MHDQTSKPVSHSSSASDAHLKGDGPKHADDADGADNAGDADM